MHSNHKNPLIIKIKVPRVGDSKKVMILIPILFLKILLTIFAPAALDRLICSLQLLTSKNFKAINPY